MAVKKETVNQIIEGLRQDMLDQLERNGAVGSYYTDMVEDWLMYWKTKKELADDIKKRGSKVTKLDSRGQQQIVNNESIDIMVKTSVQMQKILEFLGLKPPENQGGVVDEEDMEM